MSSAPAGRRPQPATLEDLLAMPEEDRYELIDGELVQKEAARLSHGRAQTRLVAAWVPTTGVRADHLSAPVAGGSPARS